MYGYRPKDLMFGSTASVLRYTCFSRIIAFLYNRLLGLPMVGYIDDFGEICPPNQTDGALSNFAQFCDRIGIALKTTKSLAPNMITFLCLLGDFRTIPTNSG